MPKRENGCLPSPTVQCAEAAQLQTVLPDLKKNGSVFTVGASIRGLRIAGLVLEIGKPIWVKDFFRGK